MSYHQYYKQIEQTARGLFPSLAGVEVAWDHLVSPLTLKLPLSVRVTAEKAITAFHRLSKKDAYIAALAPHPVGSHSGGHDSVLMAYDFHTTEDGRCYLVEINTNAAGFMLSSVMEMVQLGVPAENYRPLQDLRESFKSELKLSGHDPQNKVQVAICDESVLEQKMYPEFLMYRDWFQSFGWEAKITETKDLPPVELIYNRSTDFYLEAESSVALKQAHLSNLACVTPNPNAYWLLADKERLIQFGSDSFWAQVGGTPEDREAISEVLIPTFEKSHFGSLDEIWEQRKSLFFKPKRSHGGKSVYRGESVSRKVFERLMLEDILIQKFQPAQRVPTDDERSVLNNWKFDLRFYVYQDRVQMCVARAYQGQVTNFASPLGGFTFVQF